MTTAAFVPTVLHPDGTAVTIYRLDFSFVLIVRRHGYERARQITREQANAYRQTWLHNVDHEIAELKEELAHAIRQGEALEIPDERGRNDDSDILSVLPSSE